MPRVSGVFRLSGDVLPQRSHEGRVLGIHLGDVHAQGLQDLLVVALARRDDDGAEVAEAHAGEQDVAAGARLEADGGVLLVGQVDPPLTESLGVAVALVLRVGGEDAQVNVRALGGKVALAALEHGVAQGVELLVLGRGGPVVGLGCDVGGRLVGVWNGGGRMLVAGRTMVGKYK